MYVGSQEYYDYLKTPAWKEKAQQRRELDGHQCVLCQCYNRPLEVHHLTYDHIGDEPMDDLITVCSSCHLVVSMIGNLLRDDKLISDYRTMELYTRQYKDAVNIRIAQIILYAIKQQYNELKDQLYGCNASKVGMYIDNLMKAVDDRYQPLIDLESYSPESIAQHITYGTFKNGKTQIGNINEYLKRDARQRLPPMPQKKTWGIL